MNHLRELIETPNEQILIHSDVTRTNKEINDAMYHYKTVASRAICFDIGPITGMIGLTPIPELCKFPFRECWFEMGVVTDTGKPATAAVLCISEGGQFVGVAFLRSRPNEWSVIGSMRCDDLTDPNGGYSVMGPSEMYDPLSDAVQATMRFLSAMNCTNVHRQEHKPDTALQKARAKRGKQPLFSYWTLELNGRDGGAAQSFGGTHASPRVHLRRGHPRQYAPGKWTWVQPHAVGNRELGMVHKDYVIGKEMVVH